MRTLCVCVGGGMCELFHDAAHRWQRVCCRVEIHADMQVTTYHVGRCSDKHPQTTPLHTMCTYAESSLYTAVFARGRASCACSISSYTSPVLPVTFCKYISSWVGRRGDVGLMHDDGGSVS